MEIKTPVIKPVVLGAVKPPTAPTVAQVKTPVVAPVVKPVDTATTIEPPKPSVTTVSKEERLDDIKNAVNKVENKNKEESNSGEAEKKEQKNTKSKKSSKATLTASEKKKQVTEGQIVREDKGTKTLTEGIDVNYDDYKDKDEEVKKRLEAYPGNVVFMDIETHELKTVQELWAMGKAPHVRKLGEYVLSYDIYDDVLHKIFVDEILRVTTEKYYDDVRAKNPTLLGQYHVVTHRGRHMFDKINQRTYDYLEANGYIKDDKVVTVDVNTRCRFYDYEINEITDEVYEKTLSQKIRESSNIKTMSYNTVIEGGE